MTDAQDTIQRHYAPTFNKNVSHILALDPHIFAGTMSVTKGKGKAGSVVEQFTRPTATRSTGRGQDTPYQNVVRDRVWCYPNPQIEFAHLFDPEDDLRTLIDPSSPITMAGVDAINETASQDIDDSFFGVRKHGESGELSTAFDDALTTAGGYQIDSTTGGGGSNTGMNIEKLRAIRRTFKENHVNMKKDKVFLGITSQEEESLLAEIEVQSKDYHDGRGAPVIVEDRLIRWMGINFVESEIWAPNTATVNAELHRLLPAWTFSGMTEMTWQGLTTSLMPDASKKHYPSLMCRAVKGSTRVEEGKVLQVPCLV